MELKHLPAELIGRVTTYLAPESLVELMRTGDRHLTLLLQRNDSIQELHIEKDLPAFQPLLARVGHHLRVFKMKLPIGKLVVSPLSGLKWVSNLPKSLEVIDFDFIFAPTIWLRPVVPGEDTWLFVTSPIGYTPLHLCDLLPALRSLRLVGKTFAIDLPLPPHDYVPGILGEVSIMTHMWSIQMRQLFLKKLPHTLTSLEMPFGLELLPTLSILPPNVVRVLNNEPRNEMSWLESDLDLDFPQVDGRIENLIELKWSLHPPIFDILIPKFLNLATLNLSAIGIPGEQLQHLPSTLIDLSLCCGDFNRAYSLTPFVISSHFALLPRSLQFLRLQGFFCESMDPKSADSPGSDFLASLPSSLLVLEFSNARKQWNAEHHFRRMSTHLPKIQKFRFTSNTSPSLSITSFSWVPCATLRSLELNIEAHVDAGMHSDCLLRDEVFDTWPLDLPNEITWLSLTGPLACLLTDYIANKLPPKLTHLTLRHDFNRKITPNFLCLLPRSITSMSLHFRGIQLGTDTDERIEWNEESLLGLSKLKQPISDSILCAPPQLHTLETSIAFEGSMFQDGSIQSISLKGLEEWCKRPENGFLHGCKLYIGQSNKLPSYVPSTITELDLFVYLNSNSPVWNLKGLERLSIGGFEVSASAIKDLPILPSLKTLQILDTLDEYWLDRTLFPNLTSLKYVPNAPYKTPTKFRHAFAKLLSLDVFSSLANLEQMTEYLPDSLTSLSLRDISQHFHQLLERKKFKPKLAYLRTNSIRDDTLFLLHPHLRNLVVDYISVLDIHAMWRDLPRDLQRTTDLALAQAICPSLESVTTSYQTLWSFERTEMEAFEQEELLKQLPRTLSHFKMPHNWISRTDGLPQSLTRLNLEACANWHETLDKFPNLVSFTGDLYRLTRAWCQAVPRGLKYLQLLTYNFSSPGDSENAEVLNALPLELQSLHLPRANMGSELPSLQLRLKTLDFNIIESPLHLADLPSTLTVLKLCGVREIEPFPSEDDLLALLQQMPPSLSVWRKPWLHTKDKAKSNAWDAAYHRHTEACLALI
jgi:hypothetical protein